MFKYNHNSKPFPLRVELSNDFLAFLGLWLADGCYDRKSVILSVVSKEERELVNKIAKKYGFRYRETLHREIVNKAMARKNTPENISDYSDSTMNEESIVVWEF